MLQKECVSKSLWNVLRKLQGEELFKGYFLVGGTALSLQIGHRISDDIDLFTRENIDKEKIFDYFTQEYKDGFIKNNIQNTIVQVTVNDIKVDLVKYNYPFIEEIKEEEGIRYIGLKDIAAMKLAAISNSGDRAKYFVDLYYLLKEITLKEMFECYKGKYQQKDITHVKKSVVYFKDIPENDWETVRLLDRRLSAEKIKTTILYEVAKYNQFFNGHLKASRQKRMGTDTDHERQA